ncbi:MAG TPA: hypothetical protein VMS45_00530, partial [Gemmatimonadaceae bacterium]|nr:hypothetical protein [Gemmatimonadaceae bacterium]
MQNFPTRVARRVAFIMVLASTVGACAKDRPAPPPPAPPPAPAAAPAQDPVGLVPLPEDKTKTALNTYRITLAQIQQWGRTQSTINTVMKAHPEIEAKMKQTPPHTLDEMVALLDAQPLIHGAFKQNKMPASDFVLTMIATNEAVQNYQRKLSAKAL